MRFIKPAHHEGGALGKESYHFLPTWLRVRCHLGNPVDSHEKEKLGGNFVIPDAGLSEAVLPRPAGELEEETAEHDEVGDQENDDDKVEIEELWQIPSKTAGDGTNPDVE